jgi:YHS domain-containing protein
MRELAAGRPVNPVAHRDPVCGMAVSLEETAPAARYQNVTYRFGSDACREQFLREPKHDVGRTQTA